MSTDLAAELAAQLAQVKEGAGDGAPVVASDINGLPSETTADDEDGLKLKDLEFTDLYFSETGEAFLRGAEDIGDTGNPLSHVPAEVMVDLDELHRRVCARGQREREFFLDFDGIRYRVSRIDSINGIWFALRRAKSPVPRFGTLGLHARVVQHLGILGRKHGLIIVAGATGQGKTTTACSLLQEFLIHYGDVAITIEDPPELPLDGKYGRFGRCFQIPVEDGDFARALSSTMRYNPRYILLGEIRSPAEASQALRAAINGHLVLTTIHAGSIAEALQSMLKLVAGSGTENLDLARHILADGLAGVVHQRLVRPPKGQKGRRLVVETLFAGNDQGVRTKIRQGKIEQLGTDIELQRTRLMQNKSPIED